ncbi:MAG: hypothetical protein COZ57_14210, partial [Armatimonadetes bacterium CG_4_8_14_3_um_filter_66_20]
GDTRHLLRPDSLMEKGNSFLLKECELPLTSSPFPLFLLAAQNGLQDLGMISLSTLTTGESSTSVGG